MYTQPMKKTKPIQRLRQKNLQNCLVAKPCHAHSCHSYFCFTCLLFMQNCKNKRPKKQMHVKQVLILYSSNMSRWKKIFKCIHSLLFCFGVIEGTCDWVSTLHSHLHMPAFIYLDINMALSLKTQPISWFMGKIRCRMRQ